MKRIITFVLVLTVILSVSAPAFADLEDILGNHWLKAEMDKDFFLYYFSYLAREDFKRFNPNEAIREDEFLLSFSSLLKNMGYSTAELKFRNGIKRIEMVRAIGDNLFNIADIQADDVELPFTDISDIADEELMALKKLYSAGIIKGQSNSRFNPYAYTTQAEAVVVLQRIRDYLSSLDKDKTASREIPFTLLGTIQSYTGEEGIKTKVEDSKVVVTITKMLPTPGYIVKVEKIVKENEEYRVYLSVTPPDPDSIVPQVIVYKIITIEIDESELGEPPYSFVWG